MFVNLGKENCFGCFVSVDDIAFFLLMLYSFCSEMKKRSRRDEIRCPVNVRETGAGSKGESGRRTEKERGRKTGAKTRIKTEGILPGGNERGRKREGSHR